MCVCYILNEHFQRVTVFISAVSRLPFTVVIQVTLPTADLSSEQSRSAIQREVQDRVGARCSSRVCLHPVVTVMVVVSVATVEMTETVK